MERRSTKQRDLVYETLLQLYHPTAEEVFERIRVLHPSVGRATVFRNLTVLAQLGRVTRLSFPGDSVRYDPVVDGHTHFLCRCCGKIIDFPPISDLPIPKSDTCLIEGYSVKYYGVCRNCNPM